MAKSRLLWSLAVVLGLCALGYGRANAQTTNAGYDVECAVEGFSQTGTLLGPNSNLPGKCNLKGDYSFFFWDPDQDVDMTGVGYVTTDCKGDVVPGGIINCNLGGGVEYESFIEGG
ncbi:MAG TPA: hypothetical protein VMB26_16675, partial [Candidatus Binataceae bacterium]|nr:hypothetical protein [Candidatus Binataceae bacterium]